MQIDPYLDRIEYRVYVIEKEPLVPRTNPSFQWNDPLAPLLLSGPHAN